MKYDSSKHEPSPLTYFLTYSRKNSSIYIYIYIYNLQKFFNFDQLSRHLTDLLPPSKIHDIQDRAPEFSSGFPSRLISSLWVEVEIITAYRTTKYERFLHYHCKPSFSFSYHIHQHAALNHPHWYLSILHPFLHHSMKERCL